MTGWNGAFDCQIFRKKFIVVAFEKMRFWYPHLPFCFRLWRRDPASPKSSTWKRTVSANIFCADSSSLGEAPSWFQSIKKTHSCVEPTQWGWIHLQHRQKQQKIAMRNEGYKAQCAYSTSTTFKQKTIHSLIQEEEINTFSMLKKVSQEACLDSGTIYHMKGLFWNLQRLK